MSKSHAFKYKLAVKLSFSAKVALKSLNVVCALNIHFALKYFGKNLRCLSISKRKSALRHLHVKQFCNILLHFLCVREKDVL